MKATIVSLITPHVLRVVDLATEAQAGANVDWHLRDAVMRAMDDFGPQYNGRDLLSAYIQGLETAAQEAAPARKAYAGVLRTAAGIAARHLKESD